MRWIDSSTSGAVRHVTTDPDDRRTIRSNRLPSSFDASRTQAISRRHTSDPTPTCPIRVRGQQAQVADLQGQRRLTRH